MSKIDRFEGVVYDLPDTVYHAQKSLSSTGMKTLLKTPADFKHEVIDGNRTFKKEWDLGTAVHAKVLGTPSPVVEIPEDLLSVDGGIRSADAKAFVSQAYNDGLIPMKRAQIQQFDAVGEAVLNHPMARAMFETPGASEVSVFATDPAYGIDVRCRFDRLRDYDERIGKRLAVDLKTARKGGAAKHEAMKAVANFGYGISHHHYLHVAELAGIEVDEMVFLFAEVEPPYHVATYMLDPQAAEIGRLKAQRAYQVYAECMRTGEWPGHPLEIQSLPPAPWQIYEELGDN